MVYTYDRRFQARKSSCSRVIYFTINVWIFTRMVSFFTSAGCTRSFAIDTNYCSVYDDCSVLKRDIIAKLDSWITSFNFRISLQQYALHQRAIFTNNLFTEL
jgi:hypothetical protein